MYMMQTTKNVFSKPKINNFGCVNSKNVILESSKVDEINNKPCPNNINGLKSFICYIKFKYKMISNLSSISKHLY